MNRTMMTAIAAATVFAASAAHAAERVTFAVGEESFSIPVPDGYCVPDGRDKQIIDLTASGDKQNITPLSLIRCERRNHPDGIGLDYFLIKAPQAVLSTRIDRPEFLKMMAPEMGKAEWQEQQSGKILDGVSNGLSVLAMDRKTMAGTWESSGGEMAVSARGRFCGRRVR